MKIRRKCFHFNSNNLFIWTRIKTKVEQIDSCSGRKVGASGMSADRVAVKRLQRSLEAIKRWQWVDLLSCRVFQCWKCRTAGRSSRLWRGIPWEGRRSTTESYYPSGRICALVSHQWTLFLVSSYNCRFCFFWWMCHKAFQMKTITAGSAGGVKKLKRKIQLENELKERKIVGQFDPNKKIFSFDQVHRRCIVSTRQTQVLATV